MIVALKEAILDLSLAMSKMSPEDTNSDDWDEYTPVEPFIMVVEPRMVGLHTLLHSYRCNSSCVLCATFFLLCSLTAGNTASIVYTCKFYNV